MKKHFYLLLLFLFTAVLSRAQQLSQVSFTGGGSSVNYFSVQTEQGVHLRISEDGSLVEWGMEVRAMQGDFYAPKLQPFQGGIIYYGVEGDSISKGRIKMIGACTITYYGPFESETHIGKVKSIGRVYFDYYTQYDNKDVRGKIKTIGTMKLEYFNSFENEAYRGKLRAIGGTALTYYSNFDDRNNSGKIKSIGPAKYIWYSAMDRRDAGGGLKVGNYRQMVNGITFIMW